MKNKPEAALGAGAPRGWKHRQQVARQKMSARRDPSERAKVHAVRKRFRYQKELVDRGEATWDDFNESAPEAPESESRTDAPETVENADSGDERAAEPVSKETADMGRDELVAELEAAGVSFHANCKDDTLRSKVDALRED